MAHQGGSAFTSPAAPALLRQRGVFASGNINYNLLHRDVAVTAQTLVTGTCTLFTLLETGDATDP
jgi:hypothetical protein